LSKNEKILDFFIGKLLDKANIKYTPNGSSIKEIQTALKSASKKGTRKVGFPEFVGMSKDFIVVIEDKAELDKQANYIDNEETELAMDLKSLQDGDEKHHIIRPIFIDKNGYKLLQPVENFENFSSDNIEKYYKEQVLEEIPAETLELEEVLKKSAELHEALRNYGKLGDSEKPLVVSAILLALREKPNLADELNGDSIETDGEIIFNAVKTGMIRADVKPEVKREQVLNQFNIIKDRTNLNQIDEKLKDSNKKNELAKTPLKYFTEFLKTNVYASIVSNTSEDVLGRFYGEFLSYSSGNRKSLGVVLTPKHITDLFCDLVDLKPTDVVFDPCCGTGGFLISAMHRMLSNAKPNETETIKKDRLHGIEIREDMFSIATTNMILRGDGKSNLIKDDFLKRDLKSMRANNYTIGFINPPFSQAKGKDTAHLSEIHFIEHLIDSLAINGRCAVIVPQSIMVGKSKTDKLVKKRILEKHTLQGVVTLNKETFHGSAGTNTCIAVFTAHKPHNFESRCKFINYEDDGFVVRKHTGLVETSRAISQKRKLLDCWFDRQDAEAKFMVKTTIEPGDEWLHSFYYFNDEIPKTEDFEKTIADYLTFEFNMVLQGKENLFQNLD